MTTFNTSSITVRAAVAGLALFGASQSMAQTITGTVTDWVSDGGYAATIKNMTFATGGSAYGGAGVVVCIDPFTDFPALPSTHTYDVVGAASVITASSAYAGRAEALIDWTIDHYYTAFVNNTVSGYAFNQVLWEITQDFTGTLASLSTTTGQIFDDGTNGTDYRNMLTSLKNSYASISDTYRSTSFSVHFLSDHNTAYQDMVLVTPAVPEPSTYLMMFAGVGALMVWRRRNAAR
jgi:hypothetical protein